YICAVNYELTWAAFEKILPGVEKRHQGVFL
ncbi:unnamed protein product, partial [marine sediment metagenome]